MRLLKKVDEGGKGLRKKRDEGGRAMRKKGNEWGRAMSKDTNITCPNGDDSHRFHRGKNRYRSLCVVSMIYKQIIDP